MTNLEQDLYAGLVPQVGRICATSVVRQASARARVDPTRFRPDQRSALLTALKSSLVSFVRDPRVRQHCVAFVDKLLAGPAPAATSASAAAAGPTLDGATVPIKQEYDILVARSSASEIVERLGFSPTDRVRIVTVVSELSRNIVHYAGEGSVSFTPLRTPRGVEIKAADQGPGIANLDVILGGSYSSRTGMGIGLIGSKRLMDEFAIDTGPGRGTVVTVRKYLR
jgi:serine/threonine-protein kinase RsbT